MKLILLLIAFTSLRLFAIQCQGGSGGGGTPFTTINPPYSLDMLPTESNIDEFLVTPKTGSIIWHSELAVTRSTFGGEAEQLPETDMPLSRVMDYSESFLFTRGLASYLDLNGGTSFKRIWGQPAPFELLFSYQNFGYGVLYNADETFDLVRIDPQMNSTVIDHIEFRHGGRPQLGRGHLFPNINFFYTQDRGDQHHVWTMQVNVTNGHRITHSFSDEGGLMNFAGRVKMAIHYAGLESTAFIIDHPIRNLAWWQVDEACRYYSIGSALLPNDRLPIFASWNADRGLEIFDLSGNEEKRSFALTKALPLAPLAESDLWIGNLGKSIYVKTEPGTRTPGIIKIEIPKD